jgi:ribosomal protein L23
LYNAQRGLYTFAAQLKISKPQACAIIADLYKVTVIDVRTIKMHGKIRRSGKRQAVRALPDWKKVIVRLKSGQSIEAFHATQEDAKK